MFICREGVKMRKFFMATAGLAAMLSAAAPAVRAEEPPIVIGAAIALSGDIAPYDEGPYKALQIAIEDINAKGGVLGRKLTLVAADTKSDIAYGATAAQSVIDKGASMVVVTCDYDYGSAAANIANEKGLIAFSPCAGDPKFGPAGIGPNAYTMATSNVAEARILAEWAYGKGYRSAYVLLGLGIAFDASFAEAFEMRWKELAGDDGFLGQDTFEGDDPQISTQITRLKSLPKAPDVVVVSSYPPPGVAAVKQLRAAGVKQPILASDSWDGDFWLSGVPGLSDMYFATYGSLYGNDPRPAVNTFFSTFKTKFGALPVQSNALTGYSVLEAWVHAVEKAGSFDADKVRPVLDAFKDEPLLVGPTSFSPDVHINNSRDMALMEISGGSQGKVVGIFSPAAK